MQGSSFWKTVAIVGVIGIGSLAILEVQNRLPKQNLAGEPTEDELAQLVAQQGAGDTTVTPQMSDSEFDQMMSAAQSGDGTLFSGSEPPLEPTPEPSDSIGNDIWTNQEVAATPGSASVDTEVRSTELAQGPNPFLGQESATTVAANYQGQPSNAVAPVGFVGEEKFVGSTANEPEIQQYRRESAAPEATPEPEFPLFPSDSDVAETSADTQLSGMSPAADTAPVAVPDPTDAIKFFNGTDQPDAETEPATTAQFYQEETPPLRATPDVVTPNAATPNPFPEDISQAGSPTLAPSIESQPRAPVSFQGQNKTQPVSASPDEVISNPFQADLLEAQDEVPQPRGIQSDRVPEPEFPVFDPQPAPGPERTQPMPESSLPPVGEFDRNNTSSPFTIPELAEPGRMTIPDSAPPSDFDDRRFENGTRQFEDLPTRREPVAPPRDYNERREFGSQPQYNEDSRRLDIAPRTEPRSNLRDEQPFLNEPRSFESSPGFGTGPTYDREERERGFNNLPIRETDPFPASPEITPLRDRYDSNSLTPQPRDYRDYRDSGDTRPADYDLSSRNGRGGIRQVSGVMRPNLMLEKTAPKSATVGVPLDYKIYVRNDGDATAYEVVVEDEVTAGAKVDGARPQPELDRATNRLVWKFAEIQPNQTEEITVRLTPTGEGTLDGVASVRFKSRVKATTVITAPKLRIEMTGPTEVKIGDEVAYRYVIVNDGSGEARDVFVRTLLPNDGGLKHPQGRDLEYEIGTLAPNEQREIVLAVVAGESGEYQAEAVVSGAGGAKAQAAWRTNIIGAQLQIVRRGPTRRYVGKTATYENIVSNETNFDALDARIVESIPDGMRFKGATKGGTYDENARTVTWRINRLGAGRQEQFQIELMPTNAGDRESVVTVFENAGLQGQNYVSTTVVEDLHNVGAQMSQLDGPVAVGETFGFTITIDNRGTADATDVELLVDVPREIEVLGAGSQNHQAKLTGNNQVQYSTIVRIEPDKRQTFELRLKGNSPVRNKIVTAKVRYRQMDDVLTVGESVTIYREEL